MKNYKIDNKVISLDGGIWMYQDWKLIGDGVIIQRIGIVHLVNDKAEFEEMDITASIMKPLDLIRLRIFLSAEVITIQSLSEKMREHEKQQ